MIKNLSNKKIGYMMAAITVMMSIFFTNGLFAQNDEPDNVKIKPKRIQVDIDSKAKYNVHAGDFRYDISEDTMIVDAQNNVITVEDMRVPCNAIIEYVPAIGRNPVAIKIIIAGISASSDTKFEDEKQIE